MIWTQIMLIHNVCKPKAKFCFRETALKTRYKNVFLPSSLVDYKVCISQTGIGILEVNHRLSVTSQPRLFTNNKKVKILFSLKNKNLINDNIKESSLELNNLIPLRSWTNMIV